MTENRAKMFLVWYPPTGTPFSGTEGCSEWSILVPVYPQIFPHIIEFLIIQERTELFLVMYPTIYILIPGFWRGGGCPVFGGLGMGCPDNCELPNCHAHY